MLKKPLSPKRAPISRIALLDQKGFALSEAKEKLVDIIITEEDLLAKQKAVRELIEQRGRRTVDKKNQQLQDQVGKHIQDQLEKLKCIKKRAQCQVDLLGGPQRKITAIEYLPPEKSKTDKKNNTNLSFLLDFSNDSIFSCNKKHRNSVQSEKIGATNASSIMHERNNNSVMSGKTATSKSMVTPAKKPKNLSDFNEHFSYKSPTQKPFKTYTVAEEDCSHLRFTNSYKRSTVLWDDNFQFFAPDSLPFRGKEQHCCGNYKRVVSIEERLRQEESGEQAKSFFRESYEPEATVKGRKQKQKEYQKEQFKDQTQQRMNRDLNMLRDIKNGQRHLVSTISEMESDPKRIAYEQQRRCWSEQQRRRLKSKQKKKVKNEKKLKTVDSLATKLVKTLKNPDDTSRLMGKTVLVDGKKIGVIDILRDKLKDSPQPKVSNFNSNYKDSKSSHKKSARSQKIRSPRSQNLKSTQSQNKPSRSKSGKKKPVNSKKPKTQKTN